MSTDVGRVVWRVTAQAGDEREDACDALVLPHTASPEDAGERHVGLAVPHEGTFADRPHTLVVRARPGVGPLVVEYDVFSADGTRQMRGRSAGALTLIVRSPSSMQVTGLPDVASEPRATAG